VQINRSNLLKSGGLGVLILLVNTGFFAGPDFPAANFGQGQTRHTSRAPGAESLSFRSVTGSSHRALGVCERFPSTDRDGGSPGTEVMIQLAHEPQAESFNSKDRTGGNMGFHTLKPCPKSPNCVSSRGDTDRQRMDPIPYTGSASGAKSRLTIVVRSMKGAEVVVERDDYVHAEFTSTFLRFVDDVEFWLDASAKVIHFRSASRIGYYDFGVNRRRMEAIRTRFLKTRDSK